MMRMLLPQDGCEGHCWCALCSYKSLSAWTEPELLCIVRHSGIVVKLLK